MFSISSFFLPSFSFSAYPLCGKNEFLYYFAFSASSRAQQPVVIGVELVERGPRTEKLAKRNVAVVLRSAKPFGTDVAQHGR
jgi:hypothetical protein